jgi:hypothetical protein
MVLYGHYHIHCLDKNEFPSVEGHYHIHCLDKNEFPSVEGHCHIHCLDKNEFPLVEGHCHVHYLDKNEFSLLEGSHNDPSIQSLTNLYLMSQKCLKSDGKYTSSTKKSIHKCSLTSASQQMLPSLPIDHLNLKSLHSKIPQQTLLNMCQPHYLNQWQLWPF